MNHPSDTPPETDTTITVYQADFEVPMELAQRINDYIVWPIYVDEPPTVTTFESVDNPDIWIVRIYHNGKPDESIIQHMLSMFNAIEGLAIDQLAFNAIEERDWVSESQKHLAPIEVGRFVAYGSHDKGTIDPEKIGLLVDAGQAFGTGGHETTYGCLSFLNDLKDGDPYAIAPTNALDLGTGSGILAMAMESLWQIPILATDIDDVAVDRAAFILSENDRQIRNEGILEKGISLIVADGFDHPAFASEGPFDLITANILAEPLINLATKIHAHLSDKGTLILAGLLINQEADVLNAYQAIGMTLKKKLHRGDWSILLLQK